MKRILPYFLHLMISVIGSESVFSQVAPIGGGYTVSATLSETGEVYHSGSLGGIVTNVFIKVLKGEQPSATAYLTQIQTIYSGSGNHILAKDCNGAVYAWGGGGDGQLGNGATLASSTPVRVLKGLQSGNATAYLNNVNYISTGNLSSYALLNDGTVMSWGLGTNGRLGNGGTASSSTPVYVKVVGGANLTGITQVSGMENSAVALKSDGTVWVWGANSKNECANVGASNFAAQVTGLPKIIKISTGDFNVLALDEFGYLWNWGSNTGGMLGDGVAGGDQAVPRKVLAVGAVAPTTNYLTGVMDMGAGQTVCVAVLYDGSVVTWAGNGYGELGIGASGAVNVPVYVKNPNGIGNLSGIVYINAGDNHVLAMKADGTLYTWGRNQGGQLGLNNTTDVNLPVLVSKTYDIKLPCPVANLGPDVTLCNPIAANLYGGSQSPTYKYEWYKDGTLISSNVDNYAIGPFLWINSPGTYKIVITDTAAVTTCSPCAPSEDEITVTTNSIAPINANFCAPPDKNVSLGVSSALSTFNWYAASTGGSPLAGGTGTNSYTTPLINTTTTYYVEDTRTFPYTTGYSHLGGGGLGAASPQWALNEPVWMTFSASKTITLNSVDVFKSTACAGTISATLRLTNTGTAAFTDYTQNINCTGLSTFTFNASLVAGNYKLEFITGMNDIRIYPGAAYPMGVAGLITLDKPLGSGIVSTSGFFNWKITAPSSCGRIPVQAIKTAACPLPVTLLSFTGKRIDHASHLFWSTSEEKNSSRFEIQRSVDGINFMTIGTVQSNGNSNHIADYSFLDSDPTLSGLVYYRLKQIDMDGDIQLFDIISLNTESDETVSFNLYPNPVEKGRMININVISPYHSAFTLKMYDLTGKMIHEASYEITKGFSEQSIEMGSFPQGMYLVNIITADGQHKIVKLVVD
jgi:alpha-tubulin suppressor-like RCC1 family protein